MDGIRHLLPEPCPGERSGEDDPQYETINPLGLTITEFHENRVSVDQTGSEVSTFHPEVKR